MQNPGDNGYLPGLEYRLDRLTKPIRTPRP